MLKLTISCLSVPVLIAVAAIAVAFAMAAYGMGMLNSAVHTNTRAGGEV